MSYRTKLFCCTKFEKSGEKRLRITIVSRKDLLVIIFQIHTTAHCRHTIACQHCHNAIRNRIESRKTVQHTQISERNQGIKQFDKVCLFHLFFSEEQKLIYFTCCGKNGNQYALKNKHRSFRTHKNKGQQYHKGTCENPKQRNTQQTAVVLSRSKINQS